MWFCNGFYYILSLFYLSDFVWLGSWKSLMLGFQMPQWTWSSVTQTLVLISISSRQKGDIYEHALPTFSNKTYGKANNDIRIISFLIHILPQQSWLALLAEHTTNIELKIQDVFSVDKIFLWVQLSSFSGPLLSFYSP